MEKLLRYAQPMKAKRVGILTGGGDCPGLNAVIRAAVIVGIEKHGMEFLGIEDAMNGLLDLNYRRPRGNRWLSVEEVKPIISKGGTILGTSNRNDPFRYVVRNEEGKAVELDVSDRVLENLRQLGLEGLISIGGDGSMRIAARFMRKGLQIVGVPKTIDNDIGGTDQSFGFDTAVNIAVSAIDRLRDTAESHDRVMLVEVMGRDTGWIALHAGLAGGADAIVIPEIPYHIESLAQSIRELYKKGQSHAIVVVSEGAKERGGEASVIEEVPGGMLRLGGAAERMAQKLRQLLDADVRVAVLGHIQRGGSPSAFDRVLATRFGHAAAELVARGQWGRMVALRNGSIVDIPLEEAAQSRKRLDPMHPLILTARALGIAFGDESIRG
ncbi:MAG: ATP-dependent 6-phosphofructokinase [Sandaracinaceae bacterium]|nr:ATP-dependent 6-phosphofructokinase [Sandaracinaceae bacterium]